MKRDLAGRQLEYPPFDPLAADVPDYPDHDEKGVPIVYILGWCLAPAYLRKQLQHFCPVSAIDCAFAKRRGGGQGTFYLEAVMGGDRSIHFAFIMHLLGTECDFGCNLHHHHMKLAYNDAFNAKGYVCSSDGGRSIIKGIVTHRNLACHIRDNRHISQDIKQGRIRRLHAHLHVLPPSRRDEADAIFAKLQKEDKTAFAVLTSIPLEKWCLAYMPPEAAHHGNKTSNMVEVAAFMLLPVRSQNTMAASFFQARALIRARWVSLYHSFNRVPRSIPVRIQQFDNEALKRAATKQCAIDPKAYQLIDRDSILTNPHTLDVNITVDLLRQGQLSIMLTQLHDQLQKAWTFVHGGKDSVRQSHVVNLGCILKSDWWGLCTCRRNGFLVGYCDEVTWLLQAFGITDVFRKPWTTTKACQRQLGDKAPTSLHFDLVRTQVQTLKQKGELKQYVQPRLANSNRGGRPEDRPEGRVKSAADVLSGAHAAMKSAAQEAGSHPIPNLTPSFGQQPKEPARDSATDTPVNPNSGSHQGVRFGTDSGVAHVGSVLAHSHVVGRDDASASSGAGNATVLPTDTPVPASTHSPVAKSGDKGSTDGRRRDACEGSNASIASVHPSANPSTESASSSAAKSGGQGWGLSILGVANASGLGVTKEDYRAWVSAGAAPAPMGAPSSSTTSTTFLSSGVLKAASELFKLPTILKPHPSHPSATHHFSTTGSKNEVLQPSKTVHLPPAPFGGKAPVAATDDWGEIGSMDGDDLPAESNPINAAASAPVAQDLKNTKGKLPVPRAVNHEDAELARDLLFATQLSLQTIPGPHGAGSSSNCPWTKAPVTPPPALAAASRSPILKPPLAAPGAHDAHDAGIDYGVLAPEIAADNMAAHIAESIKKA